MPHRAEEKLSLLQWLITSDPAIVFSIIEHDDKCEKIPLISHWSFILLEFNVAFLIRTCEVVELRQRFHDDADQRQVKHGDAGLDLGICVARVGVVAGQEVVYDTDHFLM